MIKIQKGDVLYVLFAISAGIAVGATVYFVRNKQNSDSDDLDKEYSL
jgi:hypothetical protein